MSYNDIDVKVNRGIVTLSGHAESLLARERATRLTETVRGVRSVVNTVVVEPAVPVPDSEVSTDAEIERNVRSVMRMDPYILNDASIRIASRHGSKPIRPDNPAGNRPCLSVVDINGPSSRRPRGAPIFPPVSAARPPLLPPLFAADQTIAPDVLRPRGAEWHSIWHR